MENKTLEKRVCLYCNKHLVKIGKERSNGNNQIHDWSSRKYHKKCYKEQKVLEMFKISMEL
jgi:hypothetical protein